jgi:hypothetical protein
MTIVRQKRLKDVSSLCCIELVRSLIHEIRVPKNNATHVLVAGVAYPLLPDLHIAAVRTFMPIHADM